MSSTEIRAGRRVPNSSWPETELERATEKSLSEYFVVSFSQRELGIVGFKTHDEALEQYAVVFNRNRDWLNENCNEDWYYSSPWSSDTFINYFFKSKRDAALFRLFFG